MDKTFKPLMFLLVILIATVLTGCGSTVVKTNTVEVKVPVVQPCISKENIPVKPEQKVDTLRKSDTDAKKVQALMIDHVNNAPYVSRLESLVESCSEVKDAK